MEVLHDPSHEATLPRAELVGKYTSLLKAEAIAQFEPVTQQDWTAIFRQPWIDPS